MARRSKRNRRAKQAARPLAAAPAVQPEKFGALWPRLLAAAAIVAACIAVYSNSFGGAFHFDDLGAIGKNPTIRNVWDLGAVLSPPSGGETVTGRPLLNLSLAVNYAIGGTQVWGYHAVNLAIHIVASLLVFGVVRRTLILPLLRDRWGWSATGFAAAVAMLWAVHPLQTEAVTYIVQRAESLVATLYLLVLYCTIRGAQSSTRESRIAWYVAAAMACLFGMAAKEVMVTAPLVVLLFDRAFLTGSFRETLRQRWPLYASLAATWGLLAFLVTGTGLIDHQDDLGAPHPLAYVATQPGIILYYLRLCVWPAHLCLDYSWPATRDVAVVLPGIVAVGTLGLLTLWGLVRNTAWGFLGAAFFLILSPTSSFVPLADLAFEHRMYLPLAIVLTFVVAAGFLAGKAIVARDPKLATTAKVAGITGVAAAAIALAYSTYQRNEVYQSPLALWRDVVMKNPTNGRAHNNFATILMDCGAIDEALDHCRRALELSPNHSDWYSNLGEALRRKGRLAEAIQAFREAIDRNPKNADAENNLGETLRQQGNLAEAAAHFDRAVAIRPNMAEALSNRGLVLGAQGDTAGEIAQYKKALAAQPDYATAANNLGVVYCEQGRPGDALNVWQEMLRRQPDSVETLRLAAWVMATNPDAAFRNGPLAVELAERAARLADGRNMNVLDALAAAYAEVGRYGDAQAVARQAFGLAAEQGNTAMQRGIRERLRYYARGLPVRVSLPRPASQSRP